MKILHKEICLWDFVPPVLVKPVKLIRSFLGLAPGVTSAATLQPFVSPSLCSYSQFNEDLLIDLLLSCKKQGFYLDVGANDPSFNSNTKRFYDKGWSGINIEPGVNSFEKFCVNRGRDINLNIGVGPSQKTATFYQVIGDSTLSSFDAGIAEKMAAKFGLTIEEIQIEVLRLVDVFECHVRDSKVDFMSVDAEGLDLKILQSNDWKRFRPSLVIVEIDNQYQEIIQFMSSCNYRLLFNNYHNGIFVDEKTPDENLKMIVSV